MKTYNQFKEAAALALPALKAAPYVIPALGGIVKGVKAITNRETGLSDSEKRRVGELMDMIRRKKDRERTQRTEKEILDYGRERGIAERPKKRVDEENVAEAVPLIAAPLAPLVVGAGVKAAQYVMQARKQGEGKRAQPVDYGQEGDTAKPRTRNVQRPVGRRSNRSYTEQERLRRREERAAERSAQGSGTQHGPSFEKDAAEAAKRREQNISQKPLTPDQRLDNLIGKAARELGIKLPGNTLAITNRETGLSDSEKKRLKDLMDRAKADRERRKVQQPEKDILDYGRQRGIAERPKKRVDEGYKGQRKDAALNARYKELQDPKDPREQMIKDALIRLKKV